MQLDWGTVPAFCSLIISAWALFEAKKASKSTQQEKLQEQARLIVIEPLRMTQLGSAKVRVQTTVENLSDHPVSEVNVYAFSQIVSSEEFVWESFGRLESKQRLALDVAVGANEEPFPVPGDDRYRATVNFTDHNGYKWSRWANGEVKAPVDMRAKNRFIKTVWKILPSQLVHR